MAENDTMATQNENNAVGDVRSLNLKLRNIASYYDDIPTVTASGYFGEDTERAVLQFQDKFGLERTGIVDFDTWNKIVDESDRVDFLRDPISEVLIFNEGNKNIYPGDKALELYVIQAMMLALSEVIENFIKVDVTGIHDTNSVDAVKNIQNISGIDESGVINSEFSNNLAQLYEVYVTRSRV